MITAGCDIGSLTSKAVIMKGNVIISSLIIKSKPRPWESAESVMDQAASIAGLGKKDIKYSVATGYGRDKVTFVNEAITEIACHGKGAQWLMPSARTVIDIGGQDCKAMRLAKDGTMIKFTANDKCASGTGRFLEVMAKLLGLDVAELGDISLKSSNPVTLSSACTVWAQADIIQYINQKVPLYDIAAGINTAMAIRMSTIVNNIGIDNDICMTGGVAKNKGVVSALEKILGIRVKRINRADPQLAGALGAALFAAEKYSGGDL